MVLQKFPDPSRTILGHFGTFRDGFGMFQNLPDYFRNHPGLPYYHSHMLRNHLAHLQSDPGITLISQNNFRCL